MRPNLDKQIVITPEIQKNFDVAKEKLIAVRKIDKAISIAVLLMLQPPILLYNFGPAKYRWLIFVWVALCLVGIAIYFYINKEQTGEFLSTVKNMQTKTISAGSTKYWADGCINPIMDQLVSEMRFEERPSSFVGMDCTNSLKFGRHLRDNYLVKSFNDGFITDGLYENLSCDADGFALMNVKAYDNEEVKTGNTTTTRPVTKFEGPLFAVKINHKFNSPISLYTTGKGLFGESTNGYRAVKETIDVENGEFNDNFQVVSKDQTSAFRLLSPLVIENLLKLKRTYGSFGMMVDGDYLYVAIDSRKWLLAPPASLSQAQNYSLQQAVGEVQNTLKLIYSIKDAIDLTYLHN